MTSITSSKVTSRKVADLYDKHVLGNYGPAPFTLVRGEGTQVWDAENRRYLDFCTGIAVNTVGHSHPVWVERMTEQLGKLVKFHPFVRYVITNLDSSLAATDEGIMDKYADLVENPAIRDRMMSKIKQELSLTRDMLSDLLQKPFQERRKNHYFSTLLRAEALNHLHEAQMELLRKWRNSRSKQLPGEDDHLFALLQCVNAIANALGSTG